MNQTVFNVLTVFNTLAIVGFLLLALTAKKETDSLNKFALRLEEEHDAKQKAIKSEESPKSKKDLTGTSYFTPIDIPPPSEKKAAARKTTAAKTKKRSR